MDPRKPLVLDTRDLGRRPGSMRRVQLTAPAPADLAIEMIGVPAGAPLDLDLRLEAVMEGVLVTGTADVPLTGECGRCLDPVSSRLAVDLQELYAYPESEAADDEVSRLDGDFLDLEPLLRDTVVLALPLTPLCSEECAGLCPTCGEPMADLPAGHAHEQLDPRWAGLARFDTSTPTPQES